MPKYNLNTYIPHITIPSLSSSPIDIPKTKKENQSDQLIQLVGNPTNDPEINELPFVTPYSHFSTKPRTNPKIPLMSDNQLNRYSKR